MLLPNSIRTTLWLDFDSFLAGEVWRGISGHITHLSWAHYLLNFAGLVLLQQVFGKYFARWHWLPPALFIVAGTSLGLILFSHELKWYAGFWAVLIGLFYIGALKDYACNKLSSLLILTALTCYIGLQQFSGERIEGILDGVAVASRAHLFGAISGTVWVTLSTLHIRLRNKA